MILYEYAEPGRRLPDGRPPEPVGIFSLWIKEDLEKRQRIQLEQKLDRLAQVDYDIAKDWLVGTDEPGIFKVRLKGNVQVRPLCCYGPLDPKQEITFLVGATKKGGGDVSAKSLSTAAERRRLIAADSRWRIRYVTTSFAPN